MAGRLYFAVFAAAASSLALVEFYALARAKGADPLVPLGVAAGLVVNFTFYYPGLRLAIVSAWARWGLSLPFPSQAQMLTITLILIVVVISLVELFRGRGSAILNVATTVFGILYIPLFFGTLIGLREVFVPLDFPMYRYFTGAESVSNPEVIGTVYRWGGYMVISLLAMIWICDTAAFHVGSKWGRHKLFPRVSPNKSWEGAVAGFVFALLSAAAARTLVLPFLTLASALVIGAIVGVVGQLGDLVESLFKRDAGVKDSSKLLPGHGGIFDRFDSLLLVSPLVYLYVDYVLLS